MAEGGDPSYKVGFKKPPAEHRFKRGQSGNPAGRPRGAKTSFGGHPMDSWWPELWLSQGNRLVTVTINGRRVRRTMGELAVERAFADAAAGKPTAMRIVIQKMTEAERLGRERWEQGVDLMGTLHRRATAELEARRAAGEVDPLVLPHPDDFVCDKDTGTVRIVGPTDMDEHRAAMVLVRSCSALVAVLNDGPFAHADDPHRMRIIDELQELNSALPPRLQQWPSLRFAEDYELFPEICVRRWVLDADPKDAQ